MSRNKRYSAAWEKVRAERKRRRAGTPKQARDDLGFIIITAPDGSTGRKFDTKRARTEASVDNAIEFAAAKAGRGSNPKKKGK